MTFGSSRPLALLLATTMLGLVTLPSAPALAQTAAETRYSFDIQGRSVRQALNEIGRISGISVLFAETAAAAAPAGAVRGDMNLSQAITAALAGTGLTWDFTNGNTVTIRSPGATAGEEVLGTIILQQAQGGQTAPFETPAPVDYITGETIEHFRGSSPADMFRSTPGVMSGESRNGAGSVDLNIRGLQGMGRVAVKVDGAENQVTVYNGYQGIANRSFVDPDFIAGVAVTKGSDAASAGIGGSVSMNTISVDDIIKPGKKIGFRVKVEAGTNTSDPVAGQRAGYIISQPFQWGLPWNYDPANYPVGAVSTYTAPAETMNRPSALNPTQGAASIVAAVREEAWDALLGYSHRTRGNYHAGEDGRGADAVYQGPTLVCESTCQGAGGDLDWARFYPDYVQNPGLTNYRLGEEVLNTEVETRSLLFKGNLRFGGDQSLQLVYNHYDSEAADRFGSTLTGVTQSATQQALKTGVKLDSYTLKYRLAPEESQWLDLTASLWFTDLEQRSPPVYGGSNNPPAGFRSGSDTKTWGLDLSNASDLNTGWGPLSLTYGASYKSEDTKPSAGTEVYDSWIDLRNGERQEMAAWVKASLAATDWLTLNGGLRYSYMWSKDRSAPPRPLAGFPYGTARVSDSGFSPSLGVVIEPRAGQQFYATWSSTMRAPSIMESVTAFAMRVNETTHAERANNWEIGTNLAWSGVLDQGDAAFLKLGYFNYRIEDYIGREFRGNEMTIFNMHEAKLEGLELAARYERGGTSADFTASYYLDATFCRTADSCNNGTIYGDYTTNMIPPEFTLGLTVTQKLLDDRLTLGGRITRVGPRAAGHAPAAGQGASQFITKIDWDPHTLVDVFADYDFNETVSGSFRIENLTDQYYLDPLSNVLQPSPGRTFYAGLTARF